MALLTYETYKALRRGGESPVAVMSAWREQQANPTPILDSIAPMIGIMMVGIVASSLKGLIIYKWILSPSKKLAIEVEQAKQIFRPILTIDTKIEEGSVIVNEQTQKVEFTLEHAIRNWGNRPAFQTLVRGFTSPLTDTNGIRALQPIKQVNPVLGTSSNDLIHQTYGGSYSLQGKQGQVILYMRLDYSDSPNGGELYEVPYWWVFTINTEDKQASIQSVSQDWINLYSNYADKMFQK